ncbi:MAG: O-antigen ligase family protein [Gallionella sp.]|nr:O-antigen ligase family protein [Gallionella sp.]
MQAPGFWGLMLVFVLMPLPLASNRPWLVSIWGVVVGGLVLWHIWRKKSARVSADSTGGGQWQRGRVLFVLMGLWLLLLAVQITPMPIAWVQALVHAAPSPYVIDGSAFATVSIDVFSTQLYLVKGLIFAAVLWLVFSLIDTPKRLELMVKVLIFSGFFQALIAVVLLATGASYDLFFVPIDHLMRGKGTFVYHNHFAGYMELTLSLGIGLMIAKLEDKQVRNWKQRASNWLSLIVSKKALLRIVLIIMVVGLIASRSRMGNSAFFISLMLVGVLAIILSKNATKSTIVFIASLIILDVVIVGGVVGIEKVIQRIEATNLRAYSTDDPAPAVSGDVVAKRDNQGRLRYQQLREESVEARVGPGLHALEISRDFPVLGVGGGTFHLAFFPYRPIEVQGFYDHAHNDYFEFAVEVGAVGMMLLALMTMHSMVYAVRILVNRRDQFARGMAFASLMGVVALLIHSTVDFNLQNTTNGLLFIVVLSIPYLVGAQGRGTKKLTI